MAMKYLCACSRGLPHDEEEEELKKMPPRPRAKQILATGALRLLSAMWLLAQREGYILQRMQDLPEEAFLSPKDAAELLDKDYGIVVLSYGWLSKKHPDPTGLRTRTVQRYLRKHKTVSRHTPAPRLQNYGVFWDFASLPQDQPDGAEKSELEKRIFKRGLGAISLLYGDKKTLVIQLTLVPEELHLDDGSESNLTPYQARGWCFFEAAVSSLLKDSDMLLDLGAGSAALEVEEGISWKQVRTASIAKRQPPLTPDDMALELQKRKFTNGSDAELVMHKYQEFFREAVVDTEFLDFKNYSAGDGWGDAEVVALAQALPAFTNCRELYLSLHDGLGEPGLAALRARLPECPALKTLLLPTHLEETAEGQALQAWERAEEGRDVWWR